MTDNELIERAARAAGIPWPQEISGFQMQYEGTRPWNPLTDDGDALRLAVRLKLPTSFAVTDGWGAADPATLCSKQWDAMASVFVPFRESHNGDPYAATRRAIVRAAAALAE